ncbi:MAG: type I-C CRISPR-associated protein Cas8c/Csd1 [Planctomycetaceae bacterium]|nr:type I-C CRISPR-associated protein Cas8c/Csd1 [Planctomycetaceae bacterium]
MILKGLVDYYNRLTIYRNDREEENDLPGWGWILQRIDFVIILKEDGSFFQLEDKREFRDGKYYPTLFFVPSIGKQAIKHTRTGNDANLLWDNTGFVLGVGDKKDTKLNSFIETIETRMAGVSDKAIQAVLTFLKSGKNDSEIFAPVLNHSEYKEVICSPYTNISFQMLEDDDFVFNRPLIAARVSEQNEFEESYQGVCLVTGDEDQPIVEDHYAVKSLGGDTDPLLISFNYETFNSYGKKGGANSPVGFKAASQSYKALTHLLRNHSTPIGKTKVIFWTERKTPLESVAREILHGKKDDPDRKSDQVKSILESYRTGHLPVEEKNARFYVLGLEPLKARVAVRLWVFDTASVIAEKMLKHKNDTDIIRHRDTNEVIPFWRYWQALNPPKKNTNEKKGSRKKESDSHREKVELHFIRSVFLGIPYPKTLLDLALKRVRLEIHSKDKQSQVLYICAAIMKGYLSRYENYKNKPINKELDMTNMSVPYRLGRLFAVLEKIQWSAHQQSQKTIDNEESNEKKDGDKGKFQNRPVNATIIDRFYGAASRCPASGFSTPMNLVMAHLSKLDKSDRVGVRRYYEGWIQEIINGTEESDHKIDKLPKVLKPEEQAEFFLGYYQQKFFISQKKKSKTQTANPVSE